MCFVNSTVKNLSLNPCKEKYTQSRKICQMFAYQLRVMEIKITTTEAGAVGPISCPGQWSPLKLNTIFCDSRDIRIR